MANTPFELRYALSRMQRLVPHLRIWGVGWTLFVVLLFLFFCVQTLRSIVLTDLLGIAVFGGLAFGVFFLYRGMFTGLLDVMVIPVRHMDIIVEENAAGVLIGSERWYLFLDGITDLRKFRDDTWTLQHVNGSVLHIAASTITEDQIAHFRTGMERGRTREGIRAVIERGRRIKAIQESMGGGRDGETSPPSN
ncbi:MAG: hypothetical protein IT365_09715 [Candidatus Hydrogenedentes bacterium]|nr:hypothetical protein [Candidatus Hydrogenedentota bacterium]